MAYMECLGNGVMSHFRRYFGFRQSFDPKTAFEPPPVTLTSTSQPSRHWSCRLARKRFCFEDCMLSSDAIACMGLGERPTAHLAAWTSSYTCNLVVAIFGSVVQHTFI